MNKNAFQTLTKTLLLLVFFAIPLNIISQNQPMPKAKTGAFWEHVQFGGGFGLSISNTYTDITIAPSAIYNFDDHFALGTGLQYSRLKEKDFYSSNIVGGNLIGLYSPVEEIQLSLEVEEVHVSNTYTDFYNNIQKSFWNTGLYVGGGYREGGVTIGARYNVLFDKNKDIYGSALMPFIRVYF
jgi:hypothetical protein